MPLYEYSCADCHHRFEILQRLDQDAGDLVCPRCGGERLEKQFSTFASTSNGKSSSAAAACGPGSGFT